MSVAFPVSGRQARRCRLAVAHFLAWDGFIQFPTVMKMRDLTIGVESKFKVIWAGVMANWGNRLSGSADPFMPDFTAISITQRVPVLLPCSPFLTNIVG